MFDTLAFLDRLADHRTEQELDGIPDGLIDRAAVKQKHEALIRMSLKPKSAVMRLLDAQEQAKGYKGCGQEGCMCSQCMSFEEEHHDGQSTTERIDAEPEGRRVVPDQRDNPGHS